MTLAGATLSFGGFQGQDRCLAQRGREEKDVANHLNHHVTHSPKKERSLSFEFRLFFAFLTLLWWSSCMTSGFPPETFLLIKLNYQSRANAPLLQFYPSVHHLSFFFLLLGCFRLWWFSCMKGSLTGSLVWLLHQSRK